MSQIQFRCWYCNKRYAVSEDRVGERLNCSCQRVVRVPATNGGHSRAKTPAEWLIEGFVYGGGGAMLGAGLAILVISVVRIRQALILLVVLPAAGLLIGLFGGERGIHWIGQQIRKVEDR